MKNGTKIAEEFFYSYGSLEYMNDHRNRDLLEKITKKSANLFLRGGDKISSNALVFGRHEIDTEELIKTYRNNGYHDFLLDIGANIGLYSLYAAIINNSKVFAFEPAASNYFCLCKNIELNNLDNQVFPLSLSFSDKTKLAPLNMISTECGSSQNEFDYEKNDRGKTTDFIFKQASMGFTVDDFIKIYNPPLPNHLKIDVDGIENLIVKGASTLLSHKNLNDISIEINEKNQNISILYKTGKTEDIVKASDQLNLKALSKPVTKYYICYPKEQL